MNTIIHIEGLWKCYDGKQSEETSALRGLDLEVRAGETVAIYGKSGSGKTTLFNLIAGLDRPTKGTITLEGQRIHEMTESERTRYRRSRLGFVFQFFNLIPTLTALENVLLPLEMLGRDSEGARDVLIKVGLSGKEKRFPHELSGGEQQRIAIARAIVKDPVLILADEPTGNLDTEIGDQILTLLGNLSRDGGATLLLATHSERSSDIADRVLTITDGRIAEEAPDKER
ncbi:ABC transporter ATP-binding protein [bacterium]|nr:MAG: ABC transporter ATP-binding protein [bacterium]